MRPQRHVAHIEEEESYFVSMTDIVVGLLFIFIIMLMFFATRFQEATQAQSEVAQIQQELIEDLTDAEQARNEVLTNLAEMLQKRGINVSVVKDEGILRLPEEILFDRSSWDLNTKGMNALAALADALDEVLPCYTRGLRSRRTGCPITKAEIEAIFIEGHADSDPFRAHAPSDPRRQAPPAPRSQTPGSVLSWSQGTQQASPPQAQPETRRTLPPGPPKDNLDLSALRATGTFRELLKAKQELRQYLSPNNKQVLSVSGYGEYRPLQPIPGENTDNYKQRNRRIDLRLLMATPRSEDAKRLQENLQRRP